MGALFSRFRGIRVSIKNPDYHRNFRLPPKCSNDQFLLTTDVWPDFLSLAGNSDYHRMFLNVFKLFESMPTLGSLSPISNLEFYGLAAPSYPLLGRYMTTNVGLNMTTNVGSNMTTKVV